MSNRKRLMLAAGIILVLALAAIGSDYLPVPWRHPIKFREGTRAIAVIEKFKAQNGRLPNYAEFRASMTHESIYYRQREHESFVVGFDLGDEGPDGTFFGQIGHYEYESRLKEWTLFIHHSTSVIDGALF